MKAYIVTEEQFNRLFDYDEKLDKKVKLIENFLNTIVIQSYPVCKAEVNVSEVRNNYVMIIRLYLKDNDMDSDESDNMVDEIWSEIYYMFEESVAIHRVKGKC
jgi:hypothetical protein